MSRIIRPRLEPGQSIDATDLNTRFTDYSQSGALDLANHGAGSVDLPQIRTENLITIDSLRVKLGTGVYDHSAVESVPSATSSPATLYEVGGGTTRLVFGGSGWTIGTGDILRVYWDTSAEPVISGRPYTGNTNSGLLAIDDGSSGQFELNDCLACWVIHLEMDTTSAGLTNWVPVPGQGNYQSGSPAFENTSNMAAQSIVPAWLEYSAQGNATNGATDARTQKDLQWGGVSGAYWLNPTGSTTIYGLRIVAHGIYHAGFNAANNRLDLVTYVGAAAQKMQLTCGQLTAIHQRMG
tara:strand:- start:634 stop:1518 length:885 start_codon:yes stop_codon:yes gene_type:complete